MTVWWHGHEFDQRTVDMLTEVEILTGRDVDVMQGSYSGGVGASAGTHDGCGAVDLSIWGADPYLLVQEMRRVGFAAWHRTDAQGFDPHVHGIAVQPGGKWDQGCLSPGAHDQVVDYHEGRNGLASGAPDDGPREHVGTIWESYRDSQQKEPDPEPPTEDDDMILIEAPGRGVALIGPGYYNSLNPEQRDVMLTTGVRLVKHNDRGFDVAKAACMQGDQDTN